METVCVEEDICKHSKMIRYEYNSLIVAVRRLSSDKWVTKDPKDPKTLNLRTPQVSNFREFENSYESQRPESIAR